MTGPIVYTGGTFDLFHAGHVNFLRQCRRLAGPEGRVVVALNSDEFIRDYKGQAPIISYRDRRSVLLACEYVDNVVVNSGGADSKPSIQAVMPDIIAIGDDWAAKDYYAQMQFTQDWLDERGIVLAYVPYKRGISTTEIKARMTKRSIIGR